VNQFTSIVDKYRAGEITEEQATTQIMGQMQGSGISIEQLGEMIGYDPGVIRETAAKYMNPSQGGVMGAIRNAASAITQPAQGAQPQYTDQEVREFLLANPELTDVEIAQLMDQNGVSTSQIARASGETMENATRRYAAARSQYDPMTGLIGTEQAINQGTGIASGLIQGGANQAAGTLRQGMGQAETTMRAGLGIAGDTMQAGARAGEQFIRSGMGQAETTMRAGLDYARGSIGGGLNDARSTFGATQGMVGDLYRGATDQLNPYAQTGQQANQLQAALSGSIGPEAQALAYQQYQESPGVAFAREESERAILRNASALGGLSGGNVRDELSRRAVGTYMQDFGNQFNRIGDVANRGFSASGLIAGLNQSQAGIQAGLGQNLAGLEYSAGTNIGTMENAAAQNLSQLQSSGFNTLGNTQTSIGANMGVMQNAAAQNLAGIQSGTFSNIAGLEGGAASANAQNAMAAQNLIAQYRMQTGRDIDAAIGGTAGAMGGLQQGQGAGVADILGTGANNIATLLQAAQSGDAQAMENLGALLSSLGMSGSGQYSSQPIVQQQPYTFQTTNTMNQLAGIASGLSGLYGGMQNRAAPQITPQATSNYGPYATGYRVG